MKSPSPGSRYIPALHPSDMSRVQRHLALSSSRNFRRGSWSFKTGMADSRKDLVRQIRQCKLDRVTTDDPRLREKLRTLILRLEIMLSQMASC
jgi:hypothetical protein